MCPRQSYRDLMTRHRCSQNSLINEVKLAFFSESLASVPAPFYFSISTLTFFLAGLVAGLGLGALAEVTKRQLGLSKTGNLVFFYHEHFSKFEYLFIVSCYLFQVRVVASYFCQSGTVYYELYPSH